MRHLSLTKNYEFGRCYKKGRYFAHPLVVTYLIKNNVGATRLGITTSKKIGGAVVRNRARRVLRAAANAAISPTLGYDIVLVARTDTSTSKSTRLAEILSQHLKKAFKHVENK